MTDAHFRVDGGVFDLRARAIIIRDGKMLMVKNDKGGYFYPVGGRVHYGEASEDAVARECLEETGVAFEPERLVYVNECFFSGVDGSNHEIVFYYLMKQNASEIAEVTDEGLEFAWIPLNVPEGVTVYPRFFAEIKNLPETVMHIVTKELEK